MIINKSGLTIRMAVEDLRVMGRATQGVKLINLKGKTLLQLYKVMKDDVAEVIVDEDGNIIETETIERVKPVLEVLEDEVSEEDDDETKPKKMKHESDEQDDEDES
jgi:DNA gyrase subunit A